MESGRFRHKKVNFSMISNTIIRDRSISLKAKGLYTLIQSYITLDDFTLYKDFLITQCTEGKKAFESAWKELKDVGYLIQERTQDPNTKQFVWEYELLDEPYPQKGCNGFGITWQRDAMVNGGDINNIINNNTIHNNTDPIISNQFVTETDVMDQIGFSAFDTIDRPQVMEIVRLITDVLNMDGEETIRIARANRKVYAVKERFSQLNKFHIEYVLQCLRENTTKVSNLRSYLLTALYNAPMTMTSYYQNKINGGT